MLADNNCTVDAPLLDCRTTMTDAWVTARTAHAITTSMLRFPYSYCCCPGTFVITMQLLLAALLVAVAVVAQPVIMADTTLMQVCTAMRSRSRLPGTLGVSYRWLCLLALRRSLVCSVFAFLATLWRCRRGPLSRASPACRACRGGPAMDGGIQCGVRACDSQLVHHSRCDPASVTGPNIIVLPPRF